MEAITPHNKLTKSKGKVVKPVKPILKKLSHSEKNSLDLDRPWEEQQGLGIGGLSSGYESSGTSRAARDVSFTFGDSPSMPSKPHFRHGRTSSGASHLSVATTGSNSAARPTTTFVHPFQQTPRTQTPPLNYSNSSVSLDNYSHTHTATSSIRDYSPTITENEDDYPSGPISTQRPQHIHNKSTSQSSMRRPSLVSQRASSFSDASSAPLRVNTSRNSGFSRRNHTGSSLSSSLSHSDLHLSSIGVATTTATATTMDSPSSLEPTGSTPFSFTASPNPGAGGVPATAASSASPLRGSLEGVGFPRLRSRSELDAGARAEQIREARRKFEERERLKTEKHDREMIRKRERRDHKEAKELERQEAARHRKNSSAGSEAVRPSLSRKSTPTTNGINGISSSSSANDRRSSPNSSSESKRASRATELNEKPLPAFKSSNYDHMQGGTTPKFGPTVDNVAFRNARRNNSTKRKTQGYWTGFILWLRTRLFRMGRK